MTKFQARLLAARAVRTAQAQERLARSLRGGVPAQRAGDDDTTVPLKLVSGTSA